MYFKNYILFLWRIFLGNFGFNNVYKLNFVITKNCNSKCLNCNIWRVNPKNELTLPEIQKIAKSYKKIRWLEITGGEPTLRKDISEIVQAFYQGNPNLLFVHFPTNGILPEKIENQAKKISSIGRFKLVITISIDGPEIINDKLRGVPGNFRRSIETYKRLNKHPNIITYFGMTLFKSNYNMLENTYNALKKELPHLNKKDFHINIGQISEHYYENTTSNDVAPSTEFYQAIQKFKNQSKTIPTPFNLIDQIYRQLSLHFIKTGETPISCNAVKDSIYLSEKGGVYPCSMWNYPLGNIRDYQYNLQSILNTKKTTTSIELIKNKKCSHCWTPCEAYQSIIGNIAESVRKIIA